VQCRPPNRPRARRPACSPASSVTDIAFQWAGQPQKLPLPVGAISTAICMALFGPTGVSHANSISIVFARHLRAHLCDQHTQTDHATCDICSNRPHPMACTACTRCGLKTSSQYISLFGTNRLHIPPVRLSTVGTQAFSVAGPSFRHNLPEDITSAETLYTFCHRLKTHLFQRYS